MVQRLFNNKTDNKKLKNVVCNEDTLTDSMPQDSTLGLLLVNNFIYDILVLMLKLPNSSIS